LVSRATRRVQEIRSLFDDLTAERFTALHNVDTCFQNILQNPFASFRWLSLGIINSLQQDDVGHCPRLADREAHRVQTTHKAIKVSLFEFNDLVVFFEKVERQDSANFFAADTNCKLALVFIVKAACSVPVALKFVYG